MTDNRAIARLLSRLFIARTDVKAQQAGPHGAYYTHVRDRNEDPLVYLPWTMQAILQHLEGTETFGHYILDQNSNCKLVAFDLDLVKEPCLLPTLPMPPADIEEPTLGALVKQWEDTWQPRSPREAWLNRADPARDFLKTAMRDLAHVIRRELEDMEVPTTVAYTGAKGLHVYGFLPKGTPGHFARDTIEAVLDALPVSATLGKNFYAWTETSETKKLFTIETFPKQAALSDTDGFGNLMRLPLGRNKKSPDPTFFVDMTKPMGVLAPLDAQTELERVLAELEH